MKGFVVAHARSGTTWIAYALDRCTDLTARHESMGKTLPSLNRDFGGVESNGNFWRHVPGLRERFGCPVAHQVRDGRKVVRSKLTHHRGREPREAFEMWARWNQRMAHDVPATHRYRLEDLTTDFGTFRRLAVTFGAERVSEPEWENVRTYRANQTPEHMRVYPSFEAWPEERQSLFWDVCGSLMEEFGYGMEVAG